MQVAAGTKQLIFNINDHKLWSFYHIGYCIIYCMLKTIQKQLKKVIYADLSNFDQTTNTYIIPKYSKPKYDVGKMYIVKIPLDVLNVANSALASNWNHGTCPKSECLKIYVSKIVGKMIYVDSVGFDIEQNKDTGAIWSGYLPAEEISQVRAL